MHNFFLAHYILLKMRQELLNLKRFHAQKVWETFEDFDCLLLGDAMVEFEEEDDLFNLGFKVLRNELWHLNQVVHCFLFLNAMSIHNMEIIYKLLFIL